MPSPTLVSASYNLSTHTLTTVWGGGPTIVAPTSGADVIRVTKLNGQVHSWGSASQTTGLTAVFYGLVPSGTAAGTPGTISISAGAVLDAADDQPNVAINNAACTITGSDGSILTLLD